ncbi:hypothetical protein DKX38_002298 [Salix brachista]|uniref:cellulase n=1 Tax=Salix brachista TaxID=2182728 RepID=A0A5N5NLN9_9ROSI|nr:hypothetical protein DKX38_002298 [Salix brachista]
MVSVIGSMFHHGDSKNITLTLNQALMRFDAQKCLQQGTYTAVEAYGGEARLHYNSSGYIYELIWGGTWSLFSTGNTSYLGYVTDNFRAAEAEEAMSEQGVFCWNNKLTASAVLLTSLRYFHELGYPYDVVSGSSSIRLICS